MMKNFLHLIIILSSLFLIIIGCNSNKGNVNESSSRTVLKDVRSSGEMPVKIVELHPEEMTRDIMSNGKISTSEIAELCFDRSEPILDVWIKEGQHVKRGDRIARLDSYKLDNELSKLILDREKATLDLKDVLIGQGYDPENALNIPADVMRLARIRSGIDKIEASIAQTKAEIAKSVLHAPCNGVVADVKIKKFGMSKGSDIVCRILNDNNMSVEFTILEDELPFVKIGDKVEITTFATDGTYKGKISEINPLVDDKGLVRVKATLDSSKGITNGMNVRVRIMKNLGKKLSVPKNAVVLRSGREVVFTYEDGKAIWNYVTTGMQNLDKIEIIEGLEAGQKVIVEGNENLAHNSSVEIKK